MAWCCTERPIDPARSTAPSGGAGGGADAYSGARPVAEELAEELEALLGPEVAVEVRRRVAEIGD